MMPSEAREEGGTPPASAAGFVYTPMRTTDDGKSTTGVGSKGSCNRRASFLFILWLLLFFAAYVLHVLFYNFGYTGYGAWSKWTPPSSPALSDADPSATTVLLIGDSLTNRPFIRFDFGAMIRKNVPKPLILWNECQDGSKIGSVYKRLKTGLAHNASLVLLFWDTDSSDVDESLLDAAVVKELRSNYTRTLRLVINETLNYPGVKHMAIAGPGMFGTEGTLLRPLRFLNKQSCFDDYAEMNRAVAAEYPRVTYIDVRNRLKKEIPSYWLLYKWWLTVDGEHLNYRGSLIVGDMFSAWLRKMTR